MPITSDKLTQLREDLLEKRSLLVNHVERLAQDAAESTESSENSKSPISSAENASDTYEQDFAFMSMESEEHLLRKIDRALQRIHENTYGECEECGETIKPERLEALPWATMCIKCQEIEERGGRRKRSAEVDFDIADDGEEALIGDDRERV